MALEARGSAPPRRIGAPVGLGGGTGLAHGHLLRGIVWGLVFATPVWITLAVLALVVIRAHW